MATQTFVSQQEVKTEFLRLVDKTKDFYLSNPTSEVKTWIFLTRDGGIECLDRESDDSLTAIETAEYEFGSPVWLVAILDKDTDLSASGMIKLLPDLHENCEAREYYFAPVLTEDGKRRTEQLEENVRTATAEDAIKQESQPTQMTTAEFDLHGYFPGDIYNGLLTRIVRQAWEMGAGELILIHGHGRNRGISPGFVNTNTGFLGLTVRCTLKNALELRQWIFHSTINRGDSGLTTVRLKPNPTPSRNALEL